MHSLLSNLRQPCPLHYIEPIWQFVGRAVRWRVRRKHVTAAFDRGDAIVSNDPCVVLCQRHEDEYASAVLCACNPAEQKLFERGTMCSRTLHRAWNKREP